MKKLKLTPVEKYQLQNVSDGIHAVLRRIKQRPLEGQAQKDMRLLEEVSSGLECFLLSK